MTSEVMATNTSKNLFRAFSRKKTNNSLIKEKTQKMSSDEDIGLGEGGPMMVEVKKTSVHPSSRSPQRTQRDEYSDDYESDEEIWSDREEDEEVVDTSRQSGRRSKRSPAPAKTKNGRTKINMTPPDKKLKTAERKADRFREEKKADKCIHELTKCLALNRILYGADHWKLARSHCNLAEAYFELKGYAPQADYHSEIAKTIMLNSVTSYTTEQEKADIYDVLFKIYHTQGRALTTLKKYGEAEGLLAKADKVCGELSKLSCLNQDDLDDYEIKLAQATARLYWKQKKFAVAGSQYDKLLKLIEERHGMDSPQLIPVYQEYGKIEQSKGRYANHEKAIEMFLQAHSIAGSKYREGHPDLVDTALALAQAYSSTGSEEGESAAEKYLNECLASCQTLHGPHHTKTLQVQDELARLYIRTDRSQDALSLLRPMLKEKCEVHGDYSEEVSDCHKMIASIYLSQGDLEKSLKAYKKCHGIETLVLGKNHRKTKDTERTMDILMASPGLSSKFVLSKEDELKKRPKFNAIVKPSKQVGGFKSQV